MAFDDSNSGSISKNDKKTDAKHPDFKGSIKVNGEEFWISGWNKKGQYGPFVSLQVQRKDESSKSKPKPKKDEEEEESEGLFPF